MKRTCLLLTILALSFLMLASARAQSLQWSYTNEIPTLYSNGTVNVSSASDGSGGSVWLLQMNEGFFLPGFPGLPYSLTHRVIWLNKSGAPILTNDLATTTTGTINSSIIRCARNEVAIQFKESSSLILTPTTNVLRRFILTHGAVRQVDTLLDTNEVVSGVTGLLSPTPPTVAADKAGFFTHTVNPPPTEFIVHRYSN